MITIVIVTAIPYAAASAVELSKPMHDRDRADGERPVHLRHVYLADFGRRGVLDVETWSVSELDRLTRQRERAGDERLRRDDRSSRCERDQRQERPSWSETEERLLGGARIP
ncbi:MAG: hypothetical protein QM736_03740 [Vicinamibacterales bacterium]